jgi:PAS domain S-box-containing protein
MMHEIVAERAVEQAPIALLAVGRDGRIVLANARAERLFGYERGELLGQLVETLVPRALRATHLLEREEFHRAPEARPMGAGRDLRGLRKDGSEVQIEVGLAQIETAEGPRVIASVLDVSARKEAEAYLRNVNEELERRVAARTLALEEKTRELERSNHELQQFAYVASHDLQEPLRMVAGYTQLLGDRYRGRLDPDADEFIRHAVDGAERMKQLIDDILAYSRVGGEKLVPVESLKAFQSALASLEAARREAGATIEASELPRVLGDEAQLAQLVQNIIGNALKFRGAMPPVIRMSARPAQGMWRFEIADNGIGISPEHQERIFGLFKRLHRREEYPGTGIGLALCRKIVERHGGTIGVESRLGEGARFWFTLQAVDASDFRGRGTVTEM